jgi:hypothetical protein
MSADLPCVVMLELFCTTKRDSTASINCIIHAALPCLWKWTVRPNHKVSFQTCFGIRPIVIVQWAHFCLRKAVLRNYVIVFVDLINNRPEQRNGREAALDSVRNLLKAPVLLELNLTNVVVQDNRISLGGETGGPRATLGPRLLITWPTKL